MRNGGWSFWRYLKFCTPEGIFARQNRITGKLHSRHEALFVVQGGGNVSWPTNSGLRPKKGRVSLRYTVHAGVHDVLRRRDGGI